MRICFRLLPTQRLCCSCSSAPLTTAVDLAKHRPSFASPVQEEPHGGQQQPTASAVSDEPTTRI
ncbi:hypothetical protein [Oryza sativa Japonica Group]|uniref:Uncharacterized protein n=1 Tax=Oryza sativa subsp. japonica TaxID=39947 RepID=Q5ZDK2_ORYSJ|nr:hypothetical protein [Oryza sativa Japonica Group]